MTTPASERLAAFRRDISDEPVALDRIRGHYGSGSNPLREVARDGSGPLIFVGMGSSFNACQAAVWWLRRGGVPAWAQYSSELTEGEIPTGSTLIAVSQSGKTKETIGAVNAFRAAGGQTVIAVTNVEGSDLVKAAGIVLPLLAGPEGGISAKSYVASVAVLTLLAGHYLDAAELGIETLSAAVAGSEHVMSTWADRSDDVVTMLLEASVIQVVGSGAGYASALEGALILKEAPELPAEGAVTADFLHGAFHLINDRFVGIMLTDSPSGWRDGELRETVLSGGGRLISVGGTGDATITFPLSEVPLAARTMIEITPIELAAADLWAKRIGA